MNPHRDSKYREPNETREHNNNPVHWRKTLGAVINYPFIFLVGSFMLVASTLNQGSVLCDPVGHCLTSYRSRLQINTRFLLYCQPTRATRGYQASRLQHRRSTSAFCSQRDKGTLPFNYKLGAVTRSCLHTALCSVQAMC